ncbi:high affinity immunoglobulin epsilon receptor subunit beta-like [Scyliorhinus torazame]|uniref:high affinity immunoglobulin epsilon receptor subunit beta-like n=1 Tax=Scyliorhinus torazame TaxID=75743 RepID=UPI003B5D016B
MRSSHQLPRFRDVSTLYIDTVKDDGWFLKAINTFVSKELKILGITEIMIGIIQVVFGLPLNFEESYIFAVLLGVPWWTGILYIISGSLVVDIINTSNIHLKQAILLMHIVSTIAAAVGSGMYLLSLSLMEPLNSSFYLLGPLFMILFLTVLSLLEFLISSSILFLHCTLLLHTIDEMGLQMLPGSHH